MPANAADAGHDASPGLGLQGSHAGHETLAPPLGLPPLTASPEPDMDAFPRLPPRYLDVESGDVPSGRPIRRSRRLLDLDSDDDERSLFSRSVANGQMARARRRRRLIEEFGQQPLDTTPHRSAEADLHGQQRRDAAEDESTDVPVIVQARNMSALLDAASRSAYESPDEVEWRSRVEGARLRRTSANASLLALTAQSNATQPLVHLFCAHCRARVCSRAMEAHVLHGHAPSRDRDSARRTRLTRCFTSDSPPLTHQVGILSPPERVKVVDRGDGETATHWDGCACIRIETGCTGCGSHLGYVVLTPCALCLRDVASGHVFLFRAESCLVSLRGPFPPPDAPADDAEPGVVPPLDNLAPESYLTWSSSRLPSRSEDFGNNLVGDPCDWLIGSASSASRLPPDLAPLVPSTTSSSVPCRLPFWLLKARTSQAASSSSSSTASLSSASSLVRPSVSYSTAALARSPALRYPSDGANAPVRPPRPRFDLDDPDGIDVHAVCEAVDFGSLSRAQRSKDVEQVKTGPFSWRSGCVVGR